MENKKQKIKILKDGPYLVSGCTPLDKAIIVSDKECTPESWKFCNKYPEKETYALCRCGQSKNMPFCDGMHEKVNFHCTETASKNKYLENIDTIEGPGLKMTDNEKLCAVALFCHRKGDAWALTEDSAKPESKATAIQEACDCPSGRLVAWDKETRKPIEPAFEPSISLIEDPLKKTSGPLWAKGRIPVESCDGTAYEARNRVTLCRCGKSKNKPFCDGEHCKINFNDGLIP